jgi:hypothetical protein
VRQVWRWPQSGNVRHSSRKYYECARRRRAPGFFKVGSSRRPRQSRSIQRRCTRRHKTGQIKRDRARHNARGDMSHNLGPTPADHRRLLCSRTRAKCARPRTDKEGPGGPRSWPRIICSGARVTMIAGLLGPGARNELARRHTKGPAPKWGPLNRLLTARRAPQNILSRASSRRRRRSSSGPTQEDGPGFRGAWGGAISVLRISQYPRRCRRSRLISILYFWNCAWVCAASASFQFPGHSMPR